MLALQVFSDAQFYTKSAALKTLYGVLEREICVNYIVYLLREILVKFECCQYVVISSQYGNQTCMLSVLPRQVHVVYAYMN